MPISLEKNFIFIAVPKTGSSAILDMLGAYCLPARQNRTIYRRATSMLPFVEDPRKAYYRGHISARWLKVKYPKNLWKNAYKFATVRNPYDHAVSYYRFLQQSQFHPKRKTAKKWDFDQYLSYRKKKFLFEGTDQCRFIEDHRGNLLVDQVLFFEDLDNGFADLLEKLNLPKAGLLLKVNTSKHGGYRKYYNPARRAIVENLYAKDFARFGYDFKTGLPVNMTNRLKH